MEKKVKKENVTKKTAVTKKKKTSIDKRRSIAFIASECYPFVKTGGLGDVLYALPKE